MITSLSVLVRCAYLPSPLHFSYPSCPLAPLALTFDKRVDQTSRSTTLHHLIDTPVNCQTTTLRTNDNYIRSSYIRCFCNLLASTGIMARLAVHTTAPNSRIMSRADYIKRPRAYTGGARDVPPANHSDRATDQPGERRLGVIVTIGLRLLQVLI